MVKKLKTVKIRAKNAVRIPNNRFVNLKRFFSLCLILKSVLKSFKRNTWAPHISLVKNAKNWANALYWPIVRWKCGSKIDEWKRKNYNEWSNVAQIITLIRYVFNSVDWTSRQLRTRRRCITNARHSRQLTSSDPDFIYQLSKQKHSFVVAVLRNSA